MCLLEVSFLECFKSFHFLLIYVLLVFFEVIEKKYAFLKTFLFKVVLLI